MPKQAQSPARKFGVFLLESGSLTAGEHRFDAESVTPVPPEAAEALDPDTSPVKFFDTAEAAQSFHNQVRAEFIAKRTPRS